MLYDPFTKEEKQKITNQNQLNRKLEGSPKSICCSITVSNSDHELNTLKHIYGHVQNCTYGIKKRVEPRKRNWINMPTQTTLQCRQVNFAPSIDELCTVYFFLQMKPARKRTGAVISWSQNDTTSFALHCLISWLIDIHWHTSIPRFYRWSLLPKINSCEKFLKCMKSKSNSSSILIMGKKLMHSIQIKGLTSSHGSRQGLSLPF